MPQRKFDTQSANLKQGHRAAENSESSALPRNDTTKAHMPRGAGALYQNEVKEQQGKEEL